MALEEKRTLSFRRIVLLPTKQGGCLSKTLYKAVFRIWSFRERTDAWIDCRVKVSCYSSPSFSDIHPRLTSNINGYPRAMSATSRKRLLEREGNHFVELLSSLVSYPMRLVTSECRHSRVHRLIRSPLLRTETTQPLTYSASGYWSPIKESN